MSSREELAQRLQRDVRFLIAHGMLSNEQIAREIGLSVVDQQTLGLMELAGRPLTAGEIGEIAHIPSSTVTRVIDRLSAAGYVNRTTDPADRRKVLVEVDRAKLAGLAPHYEKHVGSLHEVNERFTVAELETVARYLELMRPAEGEQS